jgi:hypothetical protein
MLAACLILFFLPFVEIKCNEEPLIEASAMQLAFARPLKINTPDMFDQYLGESAEMKEAMRAINSEDRKPDVFLLAYLLFILAGVGFLFIRTPKMKHGTTIAALFALFALISFYFVYKKGWESKVSDSFEIPMINISLHFGWALWMSMTLLVLLIAFNIGTHISNGKDRALEIYDPNNNSFTEPKEEI